MPESLTPNQLEARRERTESARLDNSARVSVLIWWFCAIIGLLSGVTALCLSGTGNASLVGFAAGFIYLLLCLARPVAARYRKHLEARLPP